MIEEIWKTIPEFTTYKISNLGRVYNVLRDHIMRTSFTTFGHVKISLTSDESGIRYTRSVAQLVAEAFVRAPSVFCDHVVILDGNLSNVRAENLAWRPKWFVWKYTHQLKIPQPLHYKNLPVVNVTTDQEYRSIIEAGMAEGLLFDDIWRSTYSQVGIFPYKHIFVVDKRV